MIIIIMKSFLLLLLVWLVAGEVTGGIQVGVPSMPAQTPIAPPIATPIVETTSGAEMFAVALSILIFVSIILVLRQKRSNSTKK